MRNAPQIDGEIDIVTVTRLLGDRARVRMLDALLDGQPHAAGELARRAGVAPSTASTHLGRLSEGGLVVAEVRGRRRCYALASPAVAEALEALGRLAGPDPVRSLADANRSAALRNARTCYDHLAGRLGVGVTEALVDRRALVHADGTFELTSSGQLFLEELGVDVVESRARRRAFARSCLDGTEARPHLAGALGAAILAAFLEHDWLRRRPRDRSLSVTEFGREQFRVALGLEIA